MQTRTKVLGGIGAAAVTATIAAVVMLTSSGITNSRTGVDYGGDLQKAINEAQLGDTLALPAGSVIAQNITLPNKSGTGYVTIQSSRISELPEGKRVTPVQSDLLATIQSSTNAEPVIKTADGAHHYKLLGIKTMTSSDSVIIYDFIRLGGSRHDQTTLAQVPHDIIIDRSYIAGWPTQDSQRGVSMNCTECWVTNSYISDIHGVGIEAQAIGAWNGPGPIHIVNNYLSAAGEVVMVGGADSASPELMPADLEVRRNYMFKPLSWNPQDPSYAGKHWTVKNLFELKAVKRAVIDANVFQNNWVDAQDGSAILFTTRNQECHAPWSTVQGITFTNNTVIGADGAALNFLGKDNEAEPSYIEPSTGRPKCGDAGEVYGSIRGTDALVKNNLFYDIRGAWLMMNGFYNTTLENNTSVQRGNLITFNGETTQGFKWFKHLTTDNPYGIFGDGGTIGMGALNRYAPGWVVTGNWIAKPYDGGASYPPGNQYPDSLVLPPDFRSPIAGVGVDVDVLQAAQLGVVNPVPSPTTTPTPSMTPSVSPSPTATQPLPSPTPTLPPPSPSPTLSPSPRPSPSPSASPTPAPCLSTAWPSSVSGQNSKMQERRAQGCYPVRRTNNGMEYARP